MGNWPRRGTACTHAQTQNILDFCRHGVFWTASSEPGCSIFVERHLMLPLLSTARTRLDNSTCSKDIQVPSATPAVELLAKAICCTLASWWWLVTVSAAETPAEPMLQNVAFSECWRQGTAKELLMKEYRKVARRRIVHTRC